MDLKATLIAVLGVLPLGGSCNAAASSLTPKDRGNIAQTRAHSGPPRATTEITRFRAVDGSVRAGLARSELGGEERLHGVTELETGARLVEDATLDESGALRSAEAVLSGTDGSTLKRVLFDRERGTVLVSEASLHVQWEVPRDFTWVWAPLLNGAATNAPIMTPLDARVVFRAATGGRMVRLLDLGALRSYSLASDQVLAPENSSAIVILGDDTSETENGMPTSLTLKALHTRLVRFGSPAASDASNASDALLAAAGWSPAREPFAQ